MQDLDAKCNFFMLALNTAYYTLTSAIKKYNLSLAPKNYTMKLCLNIFLFFYGNFYNFYFHILSEFLYTTDSINTTE